MRPDMAKVLVERPRARHHDRYNVVRSRVERGDPDDLPSKQGMKRTQALHNGNRKEFTDHIEPLHRFLLSQAGRKWDDVFSEISAELRGNSTTQRHVFQHIFQYVSINVVRLDDGALLEQHYRWHKDDGIYSDLYVDPDTGILHKNPNFGKRSLWRRRDHVANPDHRVFGPEDEVFKVKGCWHRVIFIDVDPPYVRLSTDGKLVTWHPVGIDIVTNKEVRSGRYRAATRQLDSKTLRKLGLVNDAGI